MPTEDAGPPDRGLPDLPRPDLPRPDLPAAAKGWAVAAGGDKGDWGWDIAVDGQGYAYVTGHFRGQARFGPYTLTSKDWSPDVFLAKLSPDGTFLWAVRAGGPADDKGCSLTLLPDGDVVVAGLFSNTASFGPLTETSKGMADVFVARYSTDGKVKWVSHPSSPGSDWGWRVTSDGAGGVFLAGKYSGQGSFGPITLPATGGDEAFTAHLDDNGDVTWASGAGWYGEEGALGVAAAGQDSVIATGHYEWTVGFGPLSLSSAGGDDVFIVKYGAGGKVLWAQSAGGNAEDRGWAAAPDGTGGAFITGHFGGLAHFGQQSLDAKGASDLFVARYSSAGQLMWASSGGGAQAERAYAVLADGANGALVAGDFAGQASFGSHSLTAAGDRDLVLARLDENGGWDWALSAGGAGHERPGGMALGPGRALYITGDFTQTTSLGGHSLTAHGEDDVFVWKMVLP